MRRAVMLAGTPALAVRSLSMDTTPSNQQGRARGLYDEQLQRQRQEKWLFRQSDCPAGRAVVPMKDEDTPL